MPPKPQSFATHRRYVPLFHFVLSALLLANVVYWSYALARGFRWARLDGWLVSIALAILFFYARQFALTVQDRVIRLEMRLRAERLLPAELLARFAELTPRQLVALRFAGDGELADLVRRTLAGEFASADEIKKQVRDWQPDWLRA